MSLVLVLGGTRSGKSAVAEGLVAGRDVAYLATGSATDAEMATRIAVHRARRPEGWTTHDVGAEPAAVLRAVDPGRTVLLDGLGAWIASVLHHAGAFQDPTQLDPAAEAVRTEVLALAAAALARTAPTVVVHEEAGLAPVAADAATRRWVDLCGEAAQLLAGAASRVLLVVAGRTLELPAGAPTPLTDTPRTPLGKPDHGDRLVPAGHEDFAVNVEPGTPPPWLEHALATVAIGTYPDERPVTAAVADRHGRTPAEVLLLNGAAEAFWLLAAALRPRLPVIVTPSFTEPRTALLAHGLTPTLLARAESEDFTLVQVPDDADLVFVTNPCNPTGVLHAAAALTALTRPGRVLVVDESFMDLVPGEPESLAGRTGVPGLVVLRSLTKSLGIPGVRAGHLLGPPALVARLASLRQAWPLNAHALAALEAWAREEHPTATLAAEVASRRARFVTRLESLPGVHVTPGSANFVLVRVPNGPRTLAGLAAAGIAVRPTTDLGLTEHHLRIAVREEHAQDRLLDALAATL